MEQNDAMDLFAGSQTPRYEMDAGAGAERRVFLFWSCFLTIILFRLVAFDEGGKSKSKNFSFSPDDEVVACAR